MGVCLIRPRETGDSPRTKIGPLATTPIPQPHRVPKPPEPRDHPDKLADTLRKALAHAARDDPRCHQYLGRNAGRGLRIVATDGHRALVEPGTGTTGNKQILATPTPYHVRLGPAHGPMLARMRACASHRSRAVKVTIDPSGHQAPLLTLEASDPELGILSASDSVYVEGKPGRATFRINVDYLAQVCRTDVRLCYGRDTRFVVVEPIAADWRLAIACMRE